MQLWFFIVWYNNSFEGGWGSEAKPPSSENFLNILKKITLFARQFWKFEKKGTGAPLATPVLWRYFYEQHNAETFNGVLDHSGSNFERKGTEKYATE